MRDQCRLDISAQVLFSRFRRMLQVLCDSIRTRCFVRSRKLDRLQCFFFGDNDRAFGGCWNVSIKIREVCRWWRRKKGSQHGNFLLKGIGNNGRTSWLSDSAAVSLEFLLELRFSLYPILLTSTDL